MRTGASPELQWGMFYGRSGEDLRVQMNVQEYHSTPPSRVSGVARSSRAGRKRLLLTTLIYLADLWELGRKLPY